MNIFFVTVINDEPYRSRCWGFYHDFETAEQGVLENWTDMYELGCYNYAVIEEWPEGIMACSEKETWYSVVYDGNKDGKHVVTKIEKPEKFAQVVHFSIG